MDHEERESQPRVPEVIYPQFVKGLSAAITAGVFGGDASQRCSRSLDTHAAAVACAPLPLLPLCR